MRQNVKAKMLSIVIPCYNEEAAAPIFYAEIQKTLAVLKKDKKISTELIFVDDGSKDRTSDVLRELASKDRNVHYILFSRNFGKESAMLAGLEKASGDFVAVMDADLQDPPDLLPEMIDCILSGEYDCAGSRRVTRKGEPPVRSLFARMFYKLMGKITDVEIVDGARDFRVMTRIMVNAILELKERNRFSKGLFPWVGFRTKWFEYENRERVAGETKWNFWKLFLYSIDGIVAFSTKPLAMASLFGMLMFLVAIGLIVFLIIRKILFGDPVAGWPSLACIILFCNGNVLLCTGILGQYMAKTYIEVKQRPVYVVREEK